MINKLLDQVVNAYASLQMKKYQTYPSAKTAILFINVQNAFMAGKNDLSRNLLRLLDLAQKNNFLVVYAPFGGSAQVYPSPAQQKLTQLLELTEHGKNEPVEFVLGRDNIVLEPRHTLSAFNKTELDSHLRSRKIEHLIAVGPYANLSLDSSIRDGVQLGYHLTTLDDCVSAEREEELQAFKVTIPRYAQTVISLNKFESIAQKSQISKPQKGNSL
jgi:nicotinamidase-related amidase